MLLCIFIIKKLFFYFLFVYLFKKKLINQKMKMNYKLIVPKNLTYFSNIFESYKSKSFK